MEEQGDAAPVVPEEPKPKGRPGRKKGGHDSKPRIRRSFGPYKFDKATAREFIKNIKIGCPVAMAAGAAGVQVKTIYDWLRKGKGAHAPEDMKGFRRNFQLARHFAGKQDVKTLFAASIRGNIEAAKWRLSHRYPRDFSEAAMKLEVSGKQQVDLTSSDRSMSPNRKPTTAEARQELDRILAALDEHAPDAPAADVVPETVETPQEPVGAVAAADVEPKVEP
jgi:hypothetical protein